MLSDPLAPFPVVIVFPLKFVCLDAAVSVVLTQSPGLSFVGLTIVPDRNLVDSQRSVWADIAFSNVLCDHCYLTSLAWTDLVRQEPSTGFYDLGPLATGLGLAALSRFDYIERGDEELRDLTRHLGFDGHLSIWGDHGPTILRIRHANSPILTNLRLGRTLPLLGSASGRVFLTYLPDEVTRQLLENELAGDPKAEQAWAKIETVRNDVMKIGFAWVDGSVIPGLRAIAAPIPDMQRELRATMALVGASVSLVKMPNSKVDALLRAARGLGWRSASTTRTD